MVNALYHHGVKGMKWGVRKIPLKNGSLTLKKGTIVKRVSTSEGDPTYDNKKYISINQEDHDKWESYIGEYYVKHNIKTYSQTYVTTKDLKVIGSVEQGKLYTKMRLDPKFQEQAMADDNKASDYFGLQRTNDPSENISRNIAVQTKTGKDFVDAVIKENYDAIFDTHGTNVSENPVIVLNPDSNLNKYSKPEYTKPVKDFLNDYFSRIGIPTCA